MRRPVLLLTKADQTLLGLGKYPSQILIGTIVLPVCEPIETKLEANIFGFLAEHTSPKQVSLDVELLLPEGPEMNFDTSLEPIARLTMPSVTLTQEQQRFHGLKNYPPQKMIAKLVFPSAEVTCGVNYFAPRKKRHMAVEVILPGFSSDASTQTEPDSLIASNWPPLKLPLQLSDEENDLISTMVITVREIIEVDKEIEKLLLLKMMPASVPQLLLNNEILSWLVQPVARFSGNTAGRTIGIPCGTTASCEVLSMALKNLYLLRHSSVGQSMIICKEYQFNFGFPGLILAARSIRMLLGTEPCARIAQEISWTLCEILEKVFMAMRKGFTGLKTKNKILSLHRQQEWFSYGLVTSNWTRRFY